LKTPSRSKRYIGKHKTLRMKLYKFTYLILFSLLFSSCESDNGPTITEEQRQLIMGDDGAGVRLLGLAGPISIERDDVHSNLRKLDLDQNNALDVVIRAYQDFFGEKGLVISTVNTETNAEVLVNEEGFVVPLNGGDIVRFEEGTWETVEEAPLAVYDPTSQRTTGLWNGLDNRFVAFRMQDGNTRYLAWIELSVSDHDNYSFHNYGIKIVP